MAPRAEPRARGRRGRDDRGEAQDRPARPRAGARPHLSRASGSRGASGAAPGAIAEHAPAKVNLDLLITGRRADGYHELDSLVVFSAPGDRLTVQPAAALSLELSGPFAAALASEADNLVLRAARALAIQAGRPPHVHMTLEKNLPVAAGLGGGSADAAAALRALDRFWRLGLGIDGLLPLAQRLGADVPVCLAARPARMRGIGERLEPAPHLPDLALLLVNPRQSLATAAVFRALGPLPPPLPDPGPPPTDLAGLLSWLRARPNHLEPPARRLLPLIDEVLAVLAAQAGCALARMSGSGATCFGLFPDPAACSGVADALRRRQPDWWLATGMIGTPSPAA